MNHFDRIRELAFSIPAPNSITPQIIQAANSAEDYAVALEARLAAYDTTPTEPNFAVGDPSIPLDRW